MQIWFHQGNKQPSLKRKHGRLHESLLYARKTHALNMLELTSSFKYIYIRRGSTECLIEVISSSQVLQPFQTSVLQKTRNVLITVHNAQHQGREIRLVPLQALYLSVTQRADTDKR